ncbi:MAG TPA: transposase [Candidatus Aminicenantes bacterium]|nr:transposase [Candidatus Aminicenantes bacterium]
MYKPKDRDTGVLFPELLPFGGRLDERNRWLQIAALIPWAELKGEYLRHFFRLGRPTKDAQLILGLLLLKHMTMLSDRELLVTVMENPCMQAFYGFHAMATEAALDSSTLTQARKHLGPEFFRALENRSRSSSRFRRPSGRQGRSSARPRERCFDLRGGTWAI